MPRKISVHEDQILAAALKLVRREGLRALTARAVAQELGCSTQPVYRAFGSMERLREQVVRQAERRMLAYLLERSTDEPPFLQLGLGSLRFARDEPRLYRAVNRHGRVLRDLHRGSPPPPEVLQQMRSEPILASLSDEQLTRIHALMWFFSQGLATLVFGDTDGDAMLRARAYLEQAGRAVIAAELQGEGS